MFDEIFKLMGDIKDKMEELEHDIDILQEECVNSNIDWNWEQDEDVIKVLDEE